MRVFTIGKDEGCDVCVWSDDVDDVDVKDRDESFRALDPLAAAFEGTESPPLCLALTTPHKQASTKMKGILMRTHFLLHHLSHNLAAGKASRSQRLFLGAWETKQERFIKLLICL